MAIVRRLPDHLVQAALRPGVSSRDELLRDYADEVAQLHGEPEDAVRERFARFLAVYHFGTATGSQEEWERIYSGDLEHSFIRISKPFRFQDQEVIPLVLDAIRDRCRSGAAQLRVLDFGGGSGNDAIVYARCGHEAHYADLIALKNTDVVAQRFAVRGLDIPVHDARGLPDLHFDAITAIDVLEHIYDVEQALAALLARIPPGGLLCCANAFSSISYDGDHLDKNRVYVELFPLLMEAAGFARVAHMPPLEVYRRETPGEDDVRAEEARVAPLLYETSRAHCARRCAELVAVLADRGAEPAGLPLAETIGRGSGDVGATTSTAGAASGRDVRGAVLRFLVRHAPGALRRRRWRQREAALVDAMRHPTTGGQTLGSLSDYAAVLRIAEHRLSG